MREIIATKRNDRIHAIISVYQNLVILINFFVNETFALNSESPNAACLNNLFALTGTTNLRELSDKYDAADQQLMVANLWDYTDPTLLPNQIRRLLEQLDTTALNHDDKYWRNEMLWFWYHHAVSCALFKHDDIVAARFFSSEALKRQPDSHPNKITQLLYLLAHNQINAALTWLNAIEDEEERRSGEEIFSAYAKKIIKK